MNLIKRLEKYLQPKLELYTVRVFFENEKIATFNPCKLYINGLAQLLKINLYNEKGEYLMSEFIPLRKINRIKKTTHQKDV